MSVKLWIVITLVSILAFNSSAWGDTVSALLEEGIYAEETKGDLDQAISIYQKIIDESTNNSANIAEAYYRLGTCYLKKDNEAKAIGMFKELVIGFREHEEIASKARAKLVKLNAFDKEGQVVTPLELGPVPWESGETCWYDLKTSAGAVAGKMVLSVKNVTINGKDMWRIEYSSAYPSAETQTFDRVDVLKETFTPVSSITKNNFATVHTDMGATYEKGNIKFIPDNKNPKDIRNIPVEEGLAYSSNGQQWHLLRLLPITENYNTSVNIFFAQYGNVTKTQIKTTGRETVTVPAGTFDCYRLELELNPNLKTHAWISMGDKKNIVKIEGPGSIMELEKVIHAADEPQVFSDHKTGISMSAPNGWYFANSEIGTPTPYKVFLQIVAPEIKAAPGFLIAPSGGLRNVSDIVGPTMDALKKMFDNFTIRPESWAYDKIGGLPSVTYLADYDSEDKKMVEYRTYILGSQELASFILRTDKETFYEIKTDVDSIVHSFKWNRKPFGF